MALATVRKRYRNKGKPNEKFMGWQADYIDQAGKRNAKLFKLERDAKAWLAGVVIQVKQGIHTPERKSITIREAAQRWLDRPISRKTGEKIEASTLKQYRNHVEKYINPKFGGRKLSQLTKFEVVDFIDSLIRGGVTPVMAKKVLVSLKALLAEAQYRGSVSQNVAATVTLGNGKRGKRKLEIGVDIPDKPEIHAILAAAKGTRWHPILATAALAGLRSSELRGLRWEDVGEKEIRVRQRADFKNNMGAPKSAAGTRDITISDLLSKILERWREVCPPGKLVFPNGIGGTESHANIANRGLYAIQRKLDPPILKQKTDKSGQPIFDGDGKPVMQAKYGMHSFRHFFASLAIEQNHLPKRVQEMMGHSSLQMTYDRYGHLFPAGEGEREKADKAADFLHATKTA